MTIRILPTMERYHIFKLGLAILFCAAYCVRHNLVYCLEADNNLENNRNILNADHEYFQYFQGVDGRPGKDFPIYSYIPRTTFNCRGIESGYYADLETDCQVFHICEEGKKISFLCPNGTIFQQSELICEWWNKVNCTNSPNLYEESAERLQTEIARRKSSRRVAPLNGAEMNHGAIMRTEERTSFRATKNGKKYPVRQETQQIKNHRIPDNNDIEQQIEQADSNNRLLVKEQNILQTTQKNNLNFPEEKRQNHNCNDVNQNIFNNGNDAQGNGNNYIKSSRTKQTKKDINKETGNFINNNYDQASTRHSKKVEQVEKNNFNFETKTTQQKSTTLKEYHVEFGSTGSDIDSSTNSYSSSQHFNQAGNGEFLNEYKKTNLIYNNGATTKNISAKSATKAERSRNIQASSAGSVNSNNNAVNDIYGTKLSNRNVFSSTSRTPVQETNQPLLVFHSINKNYFSSTIQPPQSSKQVATTNGKVNRGSIKYNTNPNYYNNQQIKIDSTKTNFKSIPVTTFSPPVKYNSFQVSQNSQASIHETSIQENYDLPFPKHKYELTNGKSLVEYAPVTLKEQDIAISSTEPSVQFSPNNKSFNQDSDETQVLQESSSFVKNSFNRITDSSFKTSSSPYPNHRSTYSDIKDISYLEAPKIQSISSINAHLVTTQPINNGKPFVGSRVGTTLLPNQPTTQSRYTYLPTTSTDSSKPTVIFGVTRYSSTTDLPPYGPPELFNLGSSAKFPDSDRFNIGNTDKTRPTLGTTTRLTNPVPTEKFNVGSTENTIKPNVVPGLETTSLKPLEILVPEHGSLNVGSSETNVNKNQEEYNFAGTGTSLAGRFNIGDTIKSNVVPILETGTIRPLELYTGTPISDRSNIGSTDKTLPTVETTTLVTNAVPTETFNVGYTDNTIKSNMVSSFGTSIIKPLEIIVPEHGSLNKGENEPNISNGYNWLEPVNEPQFIKKTVPLLYSKQNTLISTDRTVDHATVYGTYKSTTQRSLASSNNTPYSPTVPTVTQSLLSSSTIYGSTSSSRIPKAFSQGVPIRFKNGQDKISVQLSKNLGGQTQTQQVPKLESFIQPPHLKVNTAIHVGDIQQFGISSTTLPPYTRQNDFFVTKDFNKEAPSSYSSPKTKTERPRPFARTVSIEDRFNTETNSGPNSIGSTFPAYHISSARPFGYTQTTPSTPFVTTLASPTFNIYDNVDSMMNVLQEIANYNSQKEYFGESRPGLVIPPSVGPQTLHSLAQYFANELQNGDPEKDVLKPETKEKLTNLLTAMTVHGYNNLFNNGSTARPRIPADNENDDHDATTVATKTRIGTEENDIGNNSRTLESKNTGKGDSTVSNDDLLTTTTPLPELRQLARNFSLALSSYLHDPDNFKKSLEGLRPTEPPLLDGSDNVESSTTEDELLNFSDADAKPNTPAIPSATWGYVVASDPKNSINDEVKNSLNPDLNTADSQSFIPRFNNVQFREKEQNGFTDLPPNHWTSSPQATKLWQKALSINPALVNEHLETTPSIIVSEEEDTPEPELFNQEVLPHLSEPHSQISYDLRELPPLSLNSTQVHGILIDFMNHTKSDEHNRFNRILKQLNTSEEEFLDRMKEIESNPLTKRLVLLLISECGANITQDLGLGSQYTHHRGGSGHSEETLAALESTATLTARNAETGKRENYSLGQLVHPHLSEEDQDARALQLLNSLYTIASKFGRKR